MPLVDSFVPPSVQAELYRGDVGETPQMSLSFNYKISAEIESDINELKGMGFLMPMPLGPFFQTCMLEAPEGHLRQVVEGLFNDRHLNEVGEWSEITRP